MSEDVLLMVLPLTLLKRGDHVLFLGCLKNKNTKRNKGKVRFRQESKLMNAQQYRCCSSKGIYFGINAREETPPLSTVPLSELLSLARSIVGVGHLPSLLLLRILWNYQ